MRAVMRTIVIVDDHVGFRTFARRLLEAGGLGVVGEASDGETAVDLVRRLSPDGVLLDIQLPGIDGFEVARRLATDGSSARVVFTSTRDRADYGDDVPENVFVPKHDLSAMAVLDAMGDA
jgi:DNA-binding NarL/FixJ family response regulator